MEARNIQYLKIFCFVVIAYSFIGLFRLPVTGGPCNAGLMIIATGFILIFCTILTLRSTFCIARKEYDEERNITGKLLSIVSILFWGFMGTCALLDSSILVLFYFLPLIVFNVILFISAIKIKKRAKGRPAHY